LKDPPDAYVLAAYAFLQQLPRTRKKGVLMA